MKRITLQSDAPNSVKVWEIAQELLEFSEIIVSKYSMC
jgi:hypothetical protein